MNNGLYGRAFQPPGLPDLSYKMPGFDVVVARSTATSVVACGAADEVRIMVSPRLIGNFRTGLRVQPSVWSGRRPKRRG